MVKLTIDKISVEVPEGTTILNAAKAAGVSIPSLCYLKDINEIGACRVCAVEIEGIEKLATSCNNMVEEGMSISTNSARVREARRTNIELLLSQHNSECTVCVRSGNCSLQKVANDSGILQVPYSKRVQPANWPSNFPLFRDTGKCIKCMRCVQICENVQALNVWDVEGTGSRTTVGVSQNRNIEDAGCSLCGQCITHCPVGALRERDDTQKVFEALSDPNKITVVQIAPAVRTAWGEALGLTAEQATVGRMVAALRKLGFNYIFDTNFTADLTIMEEGSEFLERLRNPEGYTAPMFTSCCPGWIRFLKHRFPDMTAQLSTAKSPQQMFGAVAKSYYAQFLEVDPSQIYCVSVMPCVAKKYECGIPTMNDAGAGQDVDLALTTRELSRMIRAAHIMPLALEEDEFDQPLGTSSGAGVIFGATGGVMEAALRSAYYLLTNKNPDPDAFRDVRGIEGWKEARFDIGDTTLRVAVASGLHNAERLIKAIRKGLANYDFVEVMACPGGCVGGGGQPIHDGCELAADRGERLYGLDKTAKLRFSHENPSVLKLYEDYMEKPLSHKSHKLLHTEH